VLAVWQTQKPTRRQTPDACTDRWVQAKRKNTKMIKKNFSESSRCLASLAVFRELYNTNTDVYGIISDFLKDIISKNGLHQFSSTEITKKINQTYDFNIPEAVIKTSLNRIENISKAYGTYSINSIADLKPKEVEEVKNKVQSANDIILERLFDFIETQKNEKLNDTDKEKVVDSFCSFLLDNSDEKEYTEYVSGFILANKNEIEFTNQLRSIKEGVVLYSGIKFNNNLNDIGSWKSTLTIFIDTEILFHSAGFNGEVYQSLFYEFYDFIKDINSKEKKIFIKYFPQTKGEIERFFTKAEHIVEGDDRANPRVTAMTEIINGCSTKGDVVAKKTNFFLDLQTMGIHEDDYSDYFIESNHEYNIGSQDVIEKIEKTTGIYGIENHLKPLNYVSIRRRDFGNDNFDNIKYIFLTGNSKTLQIAWHEGIKEFGNVPLATSLSFLTNKFWFKLNKGFGKNTFPKNFDVITKAQILLSAQVNKSVGKGYEELQKKFKEGKITEKQAMATIVGLRNQARKPEDITKDDISTILETISENNIDKFIQEQEHFKNKAELQQEENKKLKEDLQNKNSLIQTTKSEYERQLEIKEREEEKIREANLALKKSLLEEKKRSIKLLENQKTNLDKKAITSLNIFKGVIFFVILGYYGGLIFMIFKEGWDTMEQWTYILGVLPIIGSIIYLLITESSFNLTKYFQKIKERQTIKEYKSNNFKLESLNNLKEEEKKLIREIESLHPTMHIRQ